MVLASTAFERLKEKSIKMKRSLKGNQASLIVYTVEAWSLKEEGKKVSIFENNCLGTIVGVSCTNHQSGYYED